MGGRTVNIGVFLEIENNKILPVGLELIGKAMEISKNPIDNIHGIVVLPKDYNEIELDLEFEEVGKYLEQIFIYKYNDKYLSTEHCKDALCQYIELQNPSILLIGATALGRSFAPRVAAHFKTGITADCTEIKYDEEYGFIQVRPAFGEEVLAEIIAPNTFPQMATVRPGVMDLPEKYRHDSCKLNIVEKNLIEKRLNIIERLEKQEEKISLDSAEIVVIAGNAIKDPEDLLILENLAKALGGELGATRPVVDGGLAPYSRQVGVSGHSLEASIALLFGVSGSNQTMAGIRKVKKLVAINKDPNASIFKKVDIGIVDDWKEVAICILNKKGGF